MPRPSKCHLQRNILWEPSFYTDVVKTYFYFMKHLHFISGCTGFVNSSWVWLEVDDLMEKGVVSGVLRRGGGGHVHLNVYCVSGGGSQAQVVANQGTQKSLPALGSLALLPGPFSWGEEEWKDSRDMWSLLTSPLTVGSNRVELQSPFSLGKIWLGGTWCSPPSSEAWEQAYELQGVLEKCWGHCRKRCCWEDNEDKIIE